MLQHKYGVLLRMCCVIFVANIPFTILAKVQSWTRHTITHGLGDWLNVFAKFIQGWVYFSQK